jgi:NAD(P)-dependent dehydrogenase (short-subunit alcohol dehydrogenase family)
MMNSKWDLQGGLVFITGGCGLLGQQYMKAVREINGWPISLDIVGTLPKAQVGDYYQCDITKEEDIIRAVGYVQKCYPDRAILGLINNAAIDPKFQADSTHTPKSRLENYDLAQWNHEINVGLTGAFLCTKIIAPLMSKLNAGSIINVSSVLGLVAPNQALYAQPDAKEEHQPVKPVTYSVIKHAIIGLTRYTATYYASKGVRCNAIAPGGVYTTHSDEFVQKLSKYIPLNRMARKDEYSEAIKFLLTDASSFMTGSVLTIDGGQTSW